jgi:plasmid stabilization system protein ParE
MTRPVLLSARAQSDLRAIRAYIASASPANADRFLDRMLDEIQQLGHYGHGLSLAPESRHFGFELRQVIVWPYRILYRVKANCIQILHIRHGARTHAKPDSRGDPA